MEGYEADFHQERKDRATAAGQYDKKKEQMETSMQDWNEELKKKTLEVKMAILSLSLKNSVCVCVCVFVHNTVVIEEFIDKYSGTCLLRSPLGRIFLAVIDRWLL